MSKEIGEVIRAHRKKSGLTQLELADLAGVGKTVIFNIEKGKSTVQLDTLQKILRVLNITLTLESPLLKELRRSDKEARHA
jgi:y4mF family transcriptional regulator